MKYFRYDSTVKNVIIDHRPYPLDSFVNTHYMQVYIPNGWHNCVKGQPGSNIKLPPLDKKFTDYKLLSGSVISCEHIKKSSERKQIQLRLRNCGAE